MRAEFKLILAAASAVSAIVLLVVTSEPQKIYSADESAAIRKQMGMPR